MSSKSEKNSMKAHRKFFVPEKTWPINITILVIIIIFLAGVLIIGQGIDKPKGEIVFIFVMIGQILMITSFASLYLLTLIMSKNQNLKGIPLEVEKDLAVNVHYKIIAVFEDVVGASVRGSVCKISVFHPYVNSFNPLIDASGIEEAAKTHGIELKKGLVFGKKQDGTIFFIQPKKEEDSPKNLQEGFG